MQRRPGEGRQEPRFRPVPGRSSFSLSAPHEKQRLRCKAAVKKPAPFGATFLIVSMPKFDERLAFLAAICAGADLVIIFMLQALR